VGCASLALRRSQPPAPRDIHARISGHLGVELAGLQRVGLLQTSELYEHLCVRVSSSATALRHQSEGEVTPFVLPVGQSSRSQS
jgi:hypothetical protein